MYTLFHAGETVEVTYERNGERHIVEVQPTYDEEQGRYRYGMQVIVNEPLRSGDRLVIGGMLSNEKMKNYNLGYETAVNRTGGRLGISCAESDYTLGDYFTQAGAVGTAKTVSYMVRSL